MVKAYIFPILQHSIINEHKSLPLHYIICTSFQMCWLLGSHIRITIFHAFTRQHCPIQGLYASKNCTIIYSGLLSVKAPSEWSNIEVFCIQYRVSPTTQIQLNIHTLQPLMYLIIIPLFNVFSPEDGSDNVCFVLKSMCNMPIWVCMYVRSNKYISRC